MSLGIALKGPEGIVLAADSRVTLFAQRDQPGTPPKTLVIPATFDNATKLLNVAGQTHVGAITFGLGAFGQAQPRTAASFLPEFAGELVNEKRLPVEEFAQRLSAFYLRQWKIHMAGQPNPSPNSDMVFIIGGYDEGAAYGRLFSLSIPLT
jgi:hypothetical protein